MGAQRDGVIGNFGLCTGTNEAGLPTSGGGGGIEQFHIEAGPETQKSKENGDYRTTDQKPYGLQPANRHGDMQAEEKV